MVKTRFDHVAILVNSLEKAVEDYKSVLTILDPENSTDIIWEDSTSGGHKFRSATFVSKNGQTVIQLLESEHPKDKKRLKEHGEGIHHLEFCSEYVDDIAKDLKDAGIPIISSATSPSMAWQRTITISPEITHGTLVKVTTSYNVENGKWVPKK